MGILRWLFGQQKTSVQAPRDKIVDSTPQNAVEVGFTVHDGDISTGLPLSPAEISPPKAEPCRSEIESLADEAWQLYDTSRSEECVVQPALPVLFFGDGAAYRRSQLRVITVGRNPSDEEFPSDNPYARFRGAEVSDGRARSSQFYNEYLLSLHQYFQHNPYSRWFANFEQMLGGFGCSYYSGWDNTALHTDLCSPLATNPTWSKLSDEQQAQLERGGVGLWNRLVDYLQPHVILISVAEEHLSKVRFEFASEWSTLFTIHRPDGKPYHLRHRKIRIGPKQTHMIFGRAAQLPFGTVSHDDLRAAGEALKKQILAG